MLKGSLDDFALTDIFRLISLASKTGRLEVERQAGRGTVFFDDGEVYYAESSLVREPLGQKLVRAGAATEGQLRRALDDHAATGLRLGQILLSSGTVSTVELEEAVRGQTEDAVFDLLRWELGEFSWEPGERVETEVPIAVSVENLIMEASRRLDEIEIIHRKIPSSAEVLGMAVKPPEGAVEINITPDEWRMLVLVNGSRSVAEIASAVGIEEFEAMRTIYGLLSAGLVEISARAEGGDGGEPVASLEPESGGTAVVEAAPVVGEETIASAVTMPETASPDNPLEPDLEARPEPPEQAGDVMTPAEDPFGPEPVLTGPTIEPAESDEAAVERGEATLDPADLAEPAHEGIDDRPGEDPGADDPVSLGDESPPTPPLDVSAEQEEEPAPPDELGGLHEPSGENEETIPEQWWRDPEMVSEEPAESASAEAPERDGTGPEDSFSPAPEMITEPAPESARVESEPEASSEPEVTAERPLPPEESGGEAPRLERSAAAKELADLFSEGDPRRPPAPTSEPPGPDSRKRVEDDDDINRGLISRLIDGVKGL